VSDRDCLLQLFVWLIQAGYARDSREIELILHRLQRPTDAPSNDGLVYAAAPKPTPEAGK
jgi:hypothetical protein